MVIFSSTARQIRTMIAVAHLNPRRFISTFSISRIFGDSTFKSTSSLTPPTFLGFLAGARIALGLSAEVGARTGIVEKEVADQPSDLVDH
jgi:hypothetical protein